MDAEDAATCPLLALPIELRCETYSYLVHDYVESAMNNNVPFTPAFMQVNHQIRKETSEELRKLSLKELDFTEANIDLIIEHDREREEGYRLRGLTHMKILSLSEESKTQEESASFMQLVLDASVFEKLVEISLGLERCGRR